MNQNGIILAGVTAVFLLLAIISPFLVKRGFYRGVYQLDIVLLFVSIWLFWFLCYLNQMHPLIGPQIPRQYLGIIQKEWCCPTDGEKSMATETEAPAVTTLSS